MKLYFAPDSRAVRVAWLLEELGLEYELERFKLGDRAMREETYRKVHPIGRVPALEDGDVHLFESGAIVEYLLARHGNGQLRPGSDSADIPVYLQWLLYWINNDTDGGATGGRSIEQVTTGQYL